MLLTMPIAARQSVDRLFRNVGRGSVAGAMLLLVGGCDLPATSVQPSQTGTPKGSTSEPSTRPSSSQNFQVATPDGQVSVSLDGQLPPNWPSAFPIPSGAAPAGSGSLGGSAQTGLVAVYSTSTPAADTFSYYKSNSDLTPTGAKSVGVGGRYVGSMKVTAPYTGSVTVVARGGSTYIVTVVRLTGASPSG